MTFSEVMAELEELGTAQNVKVYRRHGAGDNLFGVSFANLNKLKKRIKIDDELAEQLWETGNTDAQTLAIMIADPARFTSARAERWLKTIDYYLLGDLFSGLIARSKIADAKMKKWMKSRKEYVRQVGYGVLSSRLKDEADGVPDDFCRECLETIRECIHSSANRARHAMNMAMISIGIYKPSLRKQTLAVAKRVGKVEVDHGETSCQTPDAQSYIAKAVNHPRRKER